MESVDIFLAILEKSLSIAILVYALHRMAEAQRDCRNQLAEILRQILARIARFEK